MSVAPVYDTPVQSSDQLELKLPYWRAALAYGWICGQDGADARSCHRRHPAGPVRADGHRARHP